MKKYWVYTILSLAIVALIQSSIAYTECPDPCGDYSVEVVLNKPGITYSLSILSLTPGVKRFTASNTYRVGEAFVYRSHVNPDYIVIVSEARIGALSYGTGLKRGVALSVRVEPLHSKLPYVEYYEAYIERKGFIISSKQVVQGLRKYGWSIVDSGVIDKSNKGLSTTINYAIGYKKIGGVTLYAYINYTITVNYKADTINTLFCIRFVADKVSKAIKNEAGILLNYYLEANEKPRFYLVRRVNMLLCREMLREVLRYELKWLRNIGVVQGLTDSDIINITSLVKPGCVGARAIVYYVTAKNWVYLWKARETYRGADLPTRCAVAIDLDELPEEPPGNTIYVGQFNIYTLIILAAVIASIIAIAVKLWSKKHYEKLYEQYLSRL